MRRAFAVLVLLSMALCAPAGRAPAEERKDALRPCTPADLIGAWEVIRFGTARAVAVDPSNPSFYPHQRYVFAANATVRHLTSRTKITPADHRALLAATAPATWAVDGTGKLLVQQEGATRLETAACAVLTTKVVDPRSRVPAMPGDLLLTHYDAVDRPVMRRQLRKLDRLAE
ncbi:MAG: hypothetical protein HYU25_12925 [Candidatus Rokubacteria bacterium]|nr:hypothetical protein [Candidatus Rokubacteria bacterium]